MAKNLVDNDAWNGSPAFSGRVVSSAPYSEKVTYVAEILVDQTARTTFSGAWSPARRTRRTLHGRPRKTQTAGLDS